LLRKQRKTLGGYFILPHPVHMTFLTVWAFVTGNRFFNVT